MMAFMFRPLGDERCASNKTELRVAQLGSVAPGWSIALAALEVGRLLLQDDELLGRHVAAVLADVAERVLTTGRSRAVSLTALSQGTVLLRDADASLLSVLLTNSPLKVVGRLAAPDAALLAREQAPRPGTDESSGAIRERFTSAVTNLPDREFFCLLPGMRARFTSLSVDLAARDQAAEEQRVVLAEVKQRYQVPPPAGRVTLAQAATSPRPSMRSSRRPPPPVPPPPSPWDEP